MAKYRFDDKYTFINPYNFVPNAAEKTIVRESSEKDQLHTGVLHCRLITKTPVIIPDTAQRQKTGEQDHYKYPFMEINGRAAIPGSSIRGPVRNVYEALTNSCFSTVKQNYVLQGRAKKVFKPGLLYRESGRWCIYRAVRYCIETKLVRSWEFGQYVDFEEDSARSDYRRKFAKIVAQVSGNSCGGYLCRGEYIATKKYDSIFAFEKRKGEKKTVNIDAAELEAAVNRLKNIITYYRNAEENGASDDSGNFSNYRHVDEKLFAQEKRYIPVWYSMEGNALHLSLACIGRFEYENTLNDVLGSFDVCSSRKERCAACDLFGMAGMAKKEGAAAGKLRFTDAYLQSDNAVRRYVDLKELGAPHISCLPFYLNQTESEVVGYDAVGASIRGRKFYWHHMPGKNAEGVPNNLNSTMEILEKGTFAFDVYFDKITETQLKQVLWVLCLGENDADSPMCHKIGHAKPLGFGSVKIAVDNVIERTLTRDGAYIVAGRKAEDLYFADVFKGDVDESVYSALQIITNFNSIPKDEEIRYPYVVEGVKPERKLKENVLAAHQWFSENYKFGKQETVNIFRGISEDIESMKLPRAYTVKYMWRSDYEDEKYVQKRDDFTDSNHLTERSKSTSKKPGTGQRSNKDNNSQNRNQKTPAEGKNIEGTGAVYSGKINYMNTEKGFGFIKPDEGNENIFFHISEAPDSDNMKKGDRVSYQTGTDRKGKPCAVNVNRC